jgi:hypothetical protein
MDISAPPELNDGNYISMYGNDIEFPYMSIIWKNTKLD